MGSLHRLRTYRAAKLLLLFLITVLTLMRRTLYSPSVNIYSPTYTTTWVGPIQPMGLLFCLATPVNSCTVAFSTYWRGHHHTTPGLNSRDGIVRMVDVDLLGRVVINPNSLTLVLC